MTTAIISFVAVMGADRALH